MKRIKKSLISLLAVLMLSTAIAPIAFAWIAVTPSPVISGVNRGTRVTGISGSFSRAEIYMERANGTAVFDINTQPDTNQTANTRLLNSGNMVIISHRGWRRVG